MSDLVFQPFLQRLADALARGDADCASRFHLNPLVVYTDTGPRIETTRADTVRTLRRRCAGFRLAGITSIAVRLLQVTPRDGRRVLLRSDWSYRDFAGSECGSREVIHYCALKPDGAPLIEMVELQSLAFDSPAAVAVTFPLAH